MIGQGDARLVRSDDLVQAAWIQERVVGSGADLQSILPAGFPVYARVLHPAYGPWSEQHGWLHPGGVLVAVFTGTEEVVEDSDGAESRPMEQVDPVMGLTWDEPSLAMPVFELPWREHRLLSGPLDAALEMGSVVNGVFFPHSPSLIWPNDHAWCLATDVDLRSTYIAATPALADDLLSDDRLEAWPVPPDDQLS